jgi:transcriptional regulator with XRE-family HTH domain
MDRTRRSHGPYIRARREVLGLSQNALARRARVSPSTIHRLEAGHRRGRPPILYAVAAALQLPVDDLLDRAGYLAEARYWRERRADAVSPDRDA